MKKHLLMLYLILFMLLMNQFPYAQALQKNYKWYITSAYARARGHRPNEYEITLITSEGWQVDTTFYVTFILTLIYKNSTITDTETKSVRVVLRSEYASENFVIDSGDQEETVILRNIGDHWEKKIPFNIPPEKVPRGQSVDVGIYFEVTMYIITTDQVAYPQWTNAAGDSMWTSLYRPYLSFLEWICIIAAVVVACGLSGFIIYRRRASARARSHPSSARTNLATTPHPEGS